MAEKQGFEPWLRFSRTTPLAGEPLRPLGYFSTPKFAKFFKLLDYDSIENACCQLIEQFSDVVSSFLWARFIVQALCLGLRKGEDEVELTGGD